MRNKLCRLFVLVAVFMTLVLTIIVSAHSSGYNNFYNRKHRMTNDINDAINKARWSFKEPDIEDRVRYWNQIVNKTSEELSWRWCEGERDIQWMRERHWFFGNLSYENGIVAGRFIRFIFNESNGIILSYTLKRDEGNVTVFDAITLDSFLPKESPKVLYGSNLICKGENNTVNVYDNPTATMSIGVNKGDNRIVFDLGKNFSANRTRSKNVISIEGDSIKGKLIVAGPFWWRTNRESNITIDENFVNVSLSAGFSVFFMASPIRGFGVGISDDYEDRIEEAISKCRIGARIFVQMRNRTHNRTHSMLYSNMKLNCKVDKSIIEVNVSSEEEGGQTIVIDVDNETFNIININRIQVRYDGEIISSASNYSDVLNPDDDDGKAEYLILIGSDGIQILVSIPSFSEHVILITEVSSSVGSEEETPGFGFIIVILAIVLFSFMKRKKREV